jgi:hypothetical protein
MEDRIKELEEIIRTIHSQSKDGVLTDKWIGWLSIEKSVDLSK